MQHDAVDGHVLRYRWGADAGWTVIAESDATAFKKWCLKLMDEHEDSLEVALIKGTRDDTLNTTMCVDALKFCDASAKTEL